jgi:hypothetical protein
MEELAFWIKRYSLLFFVGKKSNKKSQAESMG